jgi:hypothetical protein
MIRTWIRNTLQVNLQSPPPVRHVQRAASLRLRSHPRSLHTGGEETFLMYPLQYSIKERAGENPRGSIHHLQSLRMVSAAGRVC